MKGFWGRLFCKHKYRRIREGLALGGCDLLLMYECELCGKVIVVKFDNARHLLRNY